MSCIYGLQDPTTLEIRYVGKTNYPVEKRVKRHIYDAKVWGVYHLHHWLKQIDYRPLCVILQSDPEDINNAERFWIAKLRAEGVKLTNGTDGGDGSSPGSKKSEETRRKMSIAALGNKNAKGLLGKKKGPLSEEIKLKISLATTGRKQSPEAIEKIRLWHLGRPGPLHTEEAKRKISEAGKGNTYSLGYKHTEEARRNMSLGQRRRHSHN